MELEKEESSNFYKDWNTGRFTEEGENHYLLHIVTRWKRDDNGIKIVRSGKCV